MSRVSLGRLGAVMAPCALLGGTSFRSAHGKHRKLRKTFVEGQSNSTSLQHPDLAGGEKLQNHNRQVGSHRGDTPGLGPSLVLSTPGVPFFFFFEIHSSLGLFIDSVRAGTWVRLEVGIDGELQGSRPPPPPETA